MKYRLAIFDFDGTLADSFPFFVSVFNQLANEHGFSQIDPDSAADYKQYDAREMLKKVGLPKWKLPAVAKRFISLVQQNTDAIRLFEYTEDMLRHLVDNGVTTAIVSSNSEENIRRILGPDIAGLINHFECGMSMFGKAGRIEKVLRKTGVPNHEAIYIGDQVTDIEAARKAKLAFGAVGWGYGAIESLRKHHPEEEFDSMVDIKRIA